jgi:hypothetical protein
MSQVEASCCGLETVGILTVYGLSVYSCVIFANLTMPILILAAKYRNAELNVYHCHILVAGIEMNNRYRKALKKYSYPAQ